jgi:hypothetical protein
MMSVCAGWHLPKGRSATATGEFYDHTSNLMVKDLSLARIHHYYKLSRTADESAVTKVSTIMLITCQCRNRRVAHGSR